MKLISWNVNGFRSVKEKGFDEFFDKERADIFCIQETKMQLDQADTEKQGYFKYMSSAIKKGYSGTLVYTKVKPISVVYGINGLYNDEGRVITLEYDNFYLVNVYVPNSQEELARLDYRMIFEDNFREYLNNLKEKKNVIVCGDLNVAHKEIDIKNPKPNLRKAGFTQEERDKFSNLLESGFIDTFRYFYPEVVKYSWWSYRFQARARNAGWRIDYFLVNDSFISHVKDSLILNEVFGSDHCPVEIIID